jgi:hypothetical protein
MMIATWPFSRFEVATQAQLDWRVRILRQVRIEICGDSEIALRIQMAELKPQTATDHHSAISGNFPETRAVA